MNWATLDAQARDKIISELMEIGETCKHMGLSDTEVFWLLSTRQLPGWLVSGQWRFHRPELDAWIDANHGLERVRQEAAAAIAQHRQGRTGKSSKISG